MIYHLVIPATFEGNEAVRVLEWRLALGDAVQTGALILEVETHKALIEIRAGQGGVLRERLCGEGDWLALGKTVATLSDEPEEPLQAPAREMAVEFVIG